MGDNLFFFQTEFDFFEDGAYLPGAFAGTDNEIVRKTADTADIQ